MDNDWTSAAALFAGAHGAITANFTIFAQLYAALFNPIHNAQAGIAANLASSTAVWMKLGAVAALMLWAIAFALRRGEGSAFSEIVTRVLAPIVVANYVLQSQYQTIVQAIIDQVNIWGNAMVSGVGGSAVTGGSPFDTIWNHAFAAGVAAWNAIPVPPITDAIGEMFIIGLYMAVTAAAVGFAFALFIISQFLLYMLFAIGPIFIGFGAFQPTRFLLKGMVSALASAICTQVIILALLAVAFVVETNLLSPIWHPGGGQPVNANIWGLIDNLMVFAVILCVCTISAFKASAWAVGICGGIFDGIAPWVSAGAAAARSMGAGASAAAGAMPLGKSPAAARPAMAVAGRNMSSP